MTPDELNLPPAAVDQASMKHGRLIAAVGLALLAAAAGALAWGLDAPVLGAIAAAAGVAAAAIASISTGGPLDEAAAKARRQAARSVPVRAEPSTAPAGLAESPAPEPEVDEEAAARTPEEKANELVDPVTGMLDHRFFIVALERRVSASRRKLTPFSLVVLQLDPEDPRRHRVTDQSMKVLAAVVRAVLRESDTGCRLDDHTIGVLLEDTPEAGAVWATERVRAGFFATTFRGNVKLAAGIAAYPAHALEPDRLLAAAQDAARQSRELGDESIQLATSEESSQP